jgi:hypothetical protein
MANLRSDATCIRDELTKYGDQTWGFFIYRTCYYNDDARWESFLERMEGFAQRTLLDPRTHNSNGDGQALYDQLEWNIQSDPSLEGCSKEEIWRYEF